MTPVTTARASTIPAHDAERRRTISASNASSTNATRLARRGTSKAGSTTTGEAPSVGGSAPSLSHARIPNATAQTVANPRYPPVADERRRRRTTAA